MYKICVGGSILIRTFIFPNPFIGFFQSYFGSEVNSQLVIVSANLFNLIIGGSILWVICYPLVGIIYDGGESPAIGAVIYAVIVLVNSLLISGIFKLFKEINLLWFIIIYGLVIIIQLKTLQKIRSVKDGY